MAIPPKEQMTGNGATEAQFKSGMNNIIDFLDGDVATKSSITELKSRSSNEFIYNINLGLSYVEAVRDERGYPSALIGKNVTIHKTINHTNQENTTIYDEDGYIYHRASNADNFATIVPFNKNLLLRPDKLFDVKKVGIYYSSSTDVDLTDTDYPTGYKSEGVLYVMNQLGNNPTIHFFICKNSRKTYVGNPETKTWRDTSMRTKDCADSVLLGSKYDVIDYSDIDTIVTVAAPTELNSRFRFAKSLNNSLLHTGNTNSPSLKLYMIGGETCLSADGTQGVTWSSFNKPLLSKLNQTLIFKYKYSESGSEMRLIWQHKDNIAGRLQITQNIASTKTGTELTPNCLRVFIGGVTDGSGALNNVKEALVTANEWHTVVLSIGSGVKASSFYVDDQLIDQFTVANILNVPTTLFSSIPKIENCISLSKIATYDDVISLDQVRKLTSIYKTSRELLADYQDLSKNRFKLPNHVQFKPKYSKGLVAMLATDDASFISENIFYSFGADVSLQIASTTKILTLICCLKIEHKLNEVVEYIDFDTTYGSGLNLEIGEKVYVRDLFYNLMLPSSNVAANMLARHFGRKIAADQNVTVDDEQAKAKFVYYMNQVARNEIDMKTASFFTPSGNNGDRGTPIDLLKLGNYALIFPLLEKVWRTQTYEFMTVNTKRKIEIINGNGVMFSESRCIGGKTGSGSDGAHLVNITLMPDGQKLITATIGAANASERSSDTLVLIKVMIDQY